MAARVARTQRGGTGETAHSTATAALPSGGGRFTTELALFGSVLRDDFRSDSDVDVLVTFAPDAQISLLDLVELQHQFAALLGREVDVIEKETIETSPNWIRRNEILNTATVIYGTRQRRSA